MKAKVSDLKSVLKTWKGSLVFQLGCGFLILLTLSTCRKKDVDYIPVNTGPVSDSVVPDAFSDQPFSLMSEYELQNQQPFASALYYDNFSDLGDQLLGGSLPFSSIFKALGSVVSFFKHKQEMAELNARLDQFQAELQQIISEINALSAQLALDKTQIMNQINSINQLQWVTDIQTTYDSGSPAGLRYYTYWGNQYQLGLCDSLTMVYMIHGPQGNDFIQTFVNNNLTNGKMETAINGLYNQIIGPPGQQSTLMTYANLVLQTLGHGLSDSTAIRKSYELIENYFQYIITYQFQASIIKLNVDNYTDTTGMLAKTFIQNSFAPKIQQEIKVFLDVVDYFAANITEYRNQLQYMQDMAYVGSGLTPDNKVVNILARARFLCNTYLDAINQPYPPYCGSIIVPRYYGMGANPIPAFNVTIADRPLALDADQLFPSQIPYTYWSYRDNTQYNVNYQYDNNWRIYRFAQADGSYYNFNSYYPIGIKVVDPDANTPWFHISPITGSTTMRWYNPYNPSQTSPTKTSVCTMKFLYFSSSWRWGFMKLYYTDRNNCQLFLPYSGAVPIPGHTPYNSYTCNWGLNIGLFHSSANNLDDYTATYRDGLTPTPNRCFTLNYQHGLPSTNNSWVVTDIVGYTANLTSGLPSGWTVSAYADWYFTYLNNYIPSNTVCGFYLGTTIYTYWNSDCQPGNVVQPDQLVVNLQQVSAMNTWTTLSGMNVLTLQSLPQSNPVLQWYFGCPKPSSNINVNQSFDIKMQYIFNGLIPIDHLDMK